MNTAFVIALAAIAIAIGTAFAAWRIRTLSHAVRRLERDAAPSDRPVRNYLAAFDYSAQALVVVRRDDLEFVDANSAAERLFGFPLADVRGKKFGSLGLFARKADMERIRAAVSDGEVVQDVEAAMYHRDGSLLNVHYTTVPVTFDGGDAMMIGYEDWTDITELKRSREMLRGQLHQLQRNDTINTLVNGIAHDFNNILGIVMGFAELARREIEPGHPAQDYVAEIETASQRARDLVAQLMNYSRRGETRHSPLDLGGLVRESMRFLTAAMPPDIDIYFDLDDAEAVLDGNAAELQQVLLNLVTNAAHAMDNRGVIRLELRRFVSRKNFRVTSGVMPHGVYRTVSVRDEGAGIEPQVLQRIFDPFFTTKDIGEGTGLGLAVASNIVLEHRGGIMVESKRGVGSVFTVFLPALDPDESMADLDAGPTGILTIGSDQSTVERTCDVLSSAGIASTPVVDPTVALYTLEERPVPPACVLIGELDNEKIDSLELATRIAAIAPGTPIVTLACACTPEILENAGLNGTVTTLQSPLMPGEIVTAVNRAIDASTGRTLNDAGS
jgi:PAS domain S-box-containing protein